MITSKKLLKQNKISHGFFNRNGGKSSGIYKSLNCGSGSNDTKIKVEENLKIVMTEKDYHKIKKFNFDNLEYLKILLEINEKHIFLNTIKNLI